ncbi:MAG: PSD1 and planctomycete cytochrome C domain-containing protein [Lentisphaeraceae bacterium]|nr:PSD1 and planctomycete cytochrome C domain-containing protein [Lentisphaeraceae bacterium]
MKLIDTDNGLAIKFACQNCNQSLEIQARPCLFQCPACSQSYKLKTDNGEFSVKAIDRNVTSTEHPSANSKQKIRTASPKINTRRRRRKKKSSYMGAFVFFVIITGSAVGGTVWWNSLEKQKSSSLVSSNTDDMEQALFEGMETISDKNTQKVLVKKNEEQSHHKIVPIATSNDNKEKAFSEPMESISDENMEVSMEEEMEAVVEIPEETVVTTKPAIPRISFIRHVRPILENKCVSCHGAERQKGKLRLDTRAYALKGGDSGPALVPGNAEKSLIYHSTALDENHDDHMPAKGEPLTESELQSLKVWINNGADWTGSPLKERKTNFSQLRIPATAKRSQILKNPKLMMEQSYQIDQLIGDYYRATKTKPEGLVSDEIFVKRAYLDIAGRIPTLPEYEDFMKSIKLDKREQLVDKLVDSPAYVSHTLNQWLDALRVKFKFHKVYAGNYMQWIRNSIENNMPYDKFVHAQLSAQGSVYDPNSAAGYFVRDRGMPQDRVAAVMQTFLGTSMVCAQCHDHPLAKWTQMDFYKIMAFFEGTKMANGGAGPMLEDIKVAQKKGIKIKRGKDISRVYNVLGDKVVLGGFGMVQLPHDYMYDDAKPNQWIKANVPFGKTVRIDYSKTYSPPTESVSNKTLKKIEKTLAEKKGLADVNSRAAFADWVISKENPMFTKTIVNRLWKRAFGVALVGDPVDISEEDMGKNPRLTLYLIQMMNNLDFDQKLFMKIIYKTSAYQRIAYPQPTSPGEMPLGAPVVQRLSAEQVWDSIVTLRIEDPDKNVTKGSLSGNGARFTELNLLKKPMDRINFVLGKRKFSPQVEKERAVDTSSKYLTLTRRASLMPGFTAPSTFFGMFGRAERETIDDSVREPTIPQVLYLMNGVEVASLMDSKIKVHEYKKTGEVGTPSAVIQRTKSKSLNTQTINSIFNAVLTRKPTSSELRLIKSKFNKSHNASDLFWSLINTNEFKMKL